MADKGLGVTDVFLKIDIKPKSTSIKPHGRWIKLPIDEKERQNTIDEVVSQVGLSHPITFDGYDLCE